MDAVQPFDANDNVFTAIAHDASLADVVDFSPIVPMSGKPKVGSERDTGAS